MSEIKVRHATLADLHFVRASWFTNYWKLAASKSGVPYETYNVGHATQIHKNTENGTVLVACFESVPEEVLGWLCSRADMLQYIYVKAAFRKQGIAKLLLSGLEFNDYTHSTKPWLAYCEHNGITAQYNPYGAFL